VDRNQNARIAANTNVYVMHIAGINGLSIDTIELYERNMTDELALRLVQGSYR
jgi:hypothetical protein